MKEFLEVLAKGGEVLAQHGVVVIRDNGSAESRSACQHLAGILSQQPALQLTVGGQRTMNGLRAALDWAALERLLDSGALVCLTKDRLEITVSDVTDTVAASEFKTQERQDRVAMSTSVLAYGNGGEGGFGVAAIQAGLGAVTVNDGNFSLNFDHAVVIKAKDTAMGDIQIVNANNSQTTILQDLKPTVQLSGDSDLPQLHALLKQAAKAANEQ